MEAYRDNEFSPVFSCPACSEEHMTRGEARSCCPVEKTFRCDTCLEDFDTKGLAEKCCAKWYCGICGEEFETKKEAEKCCENEV